MSIKTKDKNEELKVNQLMDDLLVDYKQSLIEREQEEKDQIDLIKMRNETLSNHAIPFYKEKFGVSKIDKEFYEQTLKIKEMTLELFTGLLNNSTNENCKFDYLKEISPDGESLVEDFGLHLSDNNPFLELEEKIKLEFGYADKLLTTIKSNYEKYEEVHSKWTDANELQELIGDEFMTTHNTRFIAPLDFKFHQDEVVKHIGKSKELVKKYSLLKEEHSNSRKQCLRILKKINHEEKKWFNRSKRDEFHIVYQYYRKVFSEQVQMESSPYVDWKRIKNGSDSHCLNLQQVSLTV
jgi:hypothetical protein